MNAARQALASGDVNVVLPYVKPEAEAELATAFQRTQAARQAGGEAQHVAERWFFETTVRHLGPRRDAVGEQGKGSPAMPHHCDSLDGPVVKAAMRTLDANDVDLVLPFVHEPGEDEVKKAFAQVIRVRQALAAASTSTAPGRVTHAW